MRLNIYSQELILPIEQGEMPGETKVIEMVTQRADTDVTYSGVRLYLHSPEQLHDDPDDDDRSAITFWLPKSEKRREMLALQFELLANKVRAAPPETGLD